ncbi:MAG: 2OG-Fe(II) oxygenase [Paenisporosarcina sp.]
MHYLILRNFMEPKHCDEIIAIVKQRPSQIQRSKGLELTTGHHIISEHRTSSELFFRHGENPIIAEYERRIAEMTGLPVEFGEGFQFAWYKEGEYFKNHHDYFHEEYGGTQSILSRGGQRLITFMIYLNTLPEGAGGETEFTHIGLKVRPEKGKAVVFWNVMPNWQLDDSTAHAALPPAPGYEKYLLTKWIRKETFR